ncbi:erythromycin esterase family protein [Arthrobacter sp. MSA 4-2]|nr:erythromycin esterase family protein [Arthrobacter sp. MSA 4-2]
MLVGFGTHSGRVLAASRWGGAVHAMSVPAARKVSVERVLHNALGEGRTALFVFDGAEGDWAATLLGHRAIGVVYHPQMDRWRSYVPTVLNRRYDSFLWIDENNGALAPGRTVTARCRAWARDGGLAQRHLADPPRRG